MREKLDKVTEEKDRLIEEGSVQLKLIETLKKQCANLKKMVESEEAQEAILDILKSSPGNSSRPDDSVEDISPPKKPEIEMLEESQEDEEFDEEKEEECKEEEVKPIDLSVEKQETAETQVEPIIKE